MQKKSWFGVGNASNASIRSALRPDIVTDLQRSSSSVIIKKWKPILSIHHSEWYCKLNLCRKRPLWYLNLFVTNISLNYYWYYSYYSRFYLLSSTNKYSSRTVVKSYCGKREVEKGKRFIVLVQVFQHCQRNERCYFKWTAKPARLPGLPVDAYMASASSISR